MFPGRHKNQRFTNMFETVGFCHRPQLNPRLTSSFADVSSFVLTFIIVPVAVVDINGQTVFTEIVVWVTCKEIRHDCQQDTICHFVSEQTS